MLRRRSFSTVGACTLLCACSHTIAVRSEPAGAGVFLVDATGKSGALLGNTPVSFQAERMGAYRAVEVRKDGFESKQLVVPLGDASQIELGVRLNEVNTAWIVEKIRKEEPLILSRMILEMLRLQGAILSRDDAEVRRLESQMTAEFDVISAWHSMLGNYYYLKGQKAEAQKRYARALKLDPQNEEAKSMSSRIQSEGGGG